MVFRVCMKSTCEQYHKEENQKREKRGREEHIEANMPQCTIYSNIFSQQLGS